MPFLPAATINQITRTFRTPYTIVKSGRDRAPRAREEERIDRARAEREKGGRRCEEDRECANYFGDIVRRYTTDEAAQYSSFPRDY